MRTVQVYESSDGRVVPPKGGVNEIITALLWSAIALRCRYSIFFCSREKEGPREAGLDLWTTVCRVDSGYPGFVIVVLAKLGIASDMFPGGGV